jgi:exosortase D (VPLPA-CTERM-specific)
MLFALLAAVAPFWPVLSRLFDVWNLHPEYSHGIIIPPLALFLAWRQRAALSTMPFEGSWAGVLVVLVGFGLWYLAGLSTIYVIGQYGFLVVLYGMVLALAGPRLFRALAMPLLILVFMVPLPAFFSNSLSLQMQLLSSALGVDLIRLFGISVFLEGNVIDLGSFKLQVVEACDGLRYLFPLMTLAFIVAYLFRASFWKRAVVFLASVPIAILMNSARIGLIGVTVEYWGEKMAQGILHDFEGWVVFMLSIMVLLALAATLNRIGSGERSFRDALAVDFGPPVPKASAAVSARFMSTPFLAALVIALAANVCAATVPERIELKPARRSFAEFPAAVAAWDVVRFPLEKVYADDLNLDDYLLAEFRRPAGSAVSVWIAWYDSQRSGNSVHSPRSCLPGGGWQLRSLTQRTLRIDGGRNLPVNRALIEQGSERQLVYYWFQQRGRAITNEYAVKWYILHDAVTLNRTDGALVRLIVPLRAGETEAEADRELTQFTSTLAPLLPAYLPG